MPRAFILVNVEPGTEEQALKQLKSIDEVKNPILPTAFTTLLCESKQTHGRAKGPYNTQNTNVQADTININIDNDGRITRKYSHFKSHIR